jgi:hypothetical protein
MPKSFQDLENRVKMLEGKMNLVLKCASVTKRTPSTLMPGEFVTEQMSLEDLYRELQGAGAMLEKDDNGTE